VIALPSGTVIKIERAVSWRWEATGLLLFVAASLARSAGIAVVLPLMIGGSAAWIASALRLCRCDTPLMRRVTFQAFSLRWVIALFLYCASFYHWPVLRGLQAGNGFWRFSMDSLNYHTWAPQMLHAMALGLPLPNPSATVDYYVIVACIYGIFGTSPLTAIAINVFAWTAATVLLVGLFTRLRGQSPPAIVVGVLSYWPSGLIWPTQVLKDSLVALFLIAAAAACVRIIRAKQVQRGLVAVVLLTAILLPLLRLRGYVGRIMFAGSMAAIAVGLVRLLWDRREWPMVVGTAVTAAVLSITVAYVPVPDLLDAFGRSNVVRTDAAASAAVQASHYDRLPLHAVARATGRFARLLGDVVVEQPVNPSASVDALAPNKLGVMRQHFAATGGDSSVESRRALGGWRDIVSLAPITTLNALLAPYPWDVLRPRGITGPFRTFAVSESLTMMLLLPAIVVGLLRLRHVDEFFVAAVAAAGLVALGLVIPNIGTMFRLRAAFTLLLVAFATYGYDVYAWRPYRRSSTS
jgi:hypothetical protein